MWRLIKHAGEGNRGNEEVKGMYKVQEKNVEGQGFCKKDGNGCGKYIF